MKTARTKKTFLSLLSLGLLMCMPFPRGRYLPQME